MGFKDFINKMAEKQAEANEKVKLRIEKGKEEIEKGNEQAKEKITTNNEKYAQKRAKTEAIYSEKQTEIKKKMSALDDRINEIKVNNPNASRVELSDKAKEKEYQKARIAKLKKDHVPFCPKCKSTKLTFVNKKLSLGRAVVGGAVGTLAGPLGTAAGATMGGLSSKKGKVKCLNCGHTWKL